MTENAYYLMNTPSAPEDNAPDMLVDPDEDDLLLGDLLSVFGDNDAGHAA